ncbi:MAG: hypothetical protein ACKOPR_01730 [Chakrabartia godavariana]
MKTRLWMAMIALFALPGLPAQAAPAKVTGFKYEWPKALEATPALIAWLKKDRAAVYKDYAPLFNEAPEAGPGLDSYENGTSWTIQTRLASLIVLTASRWSYTGGAHGYGFTDSLIWDAGASVAVPFAGLFTNARAAEALLTPLYCRALDKARMEKRGEPTARDDMFGDCPKLFESAKIWPDKPVYAKFSRIAMSLGAYTAGPYAEGSYDLEIIIPKGLKPLVKPQYRALFPG